MKTKIYLIVMLAASIVTASAQKNSSSTIDSLKLFNADYWLSYAGSLHLLPQEKHEFIYAQQRRFIRETYFSSQKVFPAPPTVQQSCTNIDFESGNTSGWTLSTGFHPIFNNAGCCPTTGGAQTIMNAGNDPCGGFPVVSQGGSFSLRLGNNGTGGVADRIEQTFSVTAANANFTYKYAVVFQDPGHTANEQPSFQVNMLDSAGAAIPCTYYNVAAGQGIAGFQNSPNCAGVIYKPWTNVAVDLTNYIGQNVTIRFTTYDCALGGHYGYAYIDGSCLAFQTTTDDTLCVGASKTICAPAGFASYLWSGGTINNSTTQCVTVNNPGNYFVQTTMVTGCQGPTFTYNLHNYPQPNANFNTGSNNTCNMTVNFNNTSSMSSGNMTSYLWNFGDGGSSVLQSPAHTYANQGTYTVSLIVGSSKGCYDTTTQIVTVDPPPTAAFTYSTICAGAPVTFTDNSSVQQGNIALWSWDFGDGSPVSALQNPTHIYLSAGTYSVTLNIITNKGCTGSTTQIITVNPKPNLSFSTPDVCFGNISNFTNTSSGASQITNWYWDFNGDGIIDNTNQSPSYSYTLAGTYTVILNAATNANCANSYSNQVTIHPLPNVYFAVNNACHGTVSSFTNQTTIGNGNQIANYIWTFGNGGNSGQTNPTLIYANPGAYPVVLTAISNNNCSSALTQTTTVFPNPVIAFSTPDQCFGGTNLFTNNSSIQSGSITNWIWDINGDGNGDSTSQSPSFVYPSAGSYSVSLTGVSNNNCVRTYSTIVTIHPLPNVNFISNNVCLGAITSFTNQSNITNGNQIVSYNWNFGNGAGSWAAHPQFSYNNYGTYNVSLQAVSNHNCSNSSTVTVTVHPNPNVNFSSTTTCLNQATGFNNTSTIATGSIIKYRWDFDNNGSWDDSTANPTFVYPAPGNINCRLYGLSNNGCTDIQVNTVIVHANPVAQFKTHSTCLGDNTSFTNLSLSQDGNIVSYLWDFNGDNVTDNVNVSPAHYYTAYGVFMVKLEVQTQYGCVNTISKSVYVNPKPVAQFSVKNNVGCPTLCTEFTNNSSIVKGSIVTHQWQFGDGSNPDYTKNPIHCYYTGDYNVILKVVSDSGCISTMQMPSLVKVYPKPIAEFNVTPEEVDMNEPMITVSNQATGANSIQYFLGDGTHYNKDNFTHTFNLNEPQKVAIFQLTQNEYGCKDTAVRVVDVKPAYVIYIPNAFTPNADGLNDAFQAKGYGIQKFKMQIFDRWGHVIFETEDINEPWDGTMKGSSEPIKNDVYVWKAQVEDVFNKEHSLNGHVTLMK